MDKSIMATSKMAGKMVMDSQSIKIMMNMMVNGKMASKAEKQCSRIPQQEELKEDFIKMIES
jgi:hypothetical protein